MVSQTSESVAGVFTTVRHDRGLISEESAVAVGPGFGPVMIHYRPFWRPVVAGMVFVMSVFALSWYLMLGLHVGVREDGLLALGGGAALWILVTSCVAFFCGAMIANAISYPRGATWLKGAIVWGLSIPVALIIYAVASQSGPLVAGLYLPHFEFSSAAVTGVNSTVAPFGFFWTAFGTLALGLIFSIIGSMAGCACGTESSTHVANPSTGNGI